MSDLDSHCNPDLLNEGTAIMPSIKRWPLITIRIIRADPIYLPKQMANCKFPNLKYLHLHTEGITSLDGLGKIEMPSLESFLSSTLRVIQRTVSLTVGRF